jgi:hypothetical protein
VLPQPATTINAAIIPTARVTPLDMGGL